MRKLPRYPRAADGLQRVTAPGDALTALGQCIDVVRVLETGFAANAETLEGEWLTRTESAQLSHPGDPMLQYLAGVTCMRLQLRGKARQLLQQSLVRLQDASLRRDARRLLAELALDQGDEQAATDAWNRAAQS